MGPTTSIISDASCLPLSTPLIAVMTLFYAIGHWNQFFLAMIYLSDKALYPLQIILRDILIQSQVDMNMMEDLQSMAAKQAMRELLKYALIVVASVPVLITLPVCATVFRSRDDAWSAQRVMLLPEVGHNVIVSILVCIIYWSSKARTLSHILPAPKIGHKGGVNV